MCCCGFKGECECLYYLVFLKKTDDGDSGNEEPREPGDYYQTTQEQVHHQPQHLHQQQQQLQQETSVTMLAASSDGQALDSEEVDFVGESATADVDMAGPEGPSGSSVESSIAGALMLPGAAAGQPSLSIAGPSGTANVVGGGIVSGASVSSSSANSMLAMGTATGAGLPGCSVTGCAGSMRALDARRLVLRNSEGRREILQEQLIQLTVPRPREVLDPALIHRMPPEG